METTQFELPGSPRTIVYMNERLKNHKCYTNALYQLFTARSLEGVLAPVVGMPDLTASYGLPVGGILAIDAETGVISLNAIGGDINCGISLSQTDISISSLKLTDNSKDANLRKLANTLEKKLEMSSDINPQLVLTTGANFISSSEDVVKIENKGFLPLSNNSLLTPEILAKARSQLGTLGGGNHFIDLMYCQEVFDDELAILWGIDNLNVQFVLHSGSRGVGSLIREKYSNPELYDDKVSRVFQPRKFNTPKGREILDAVYMASNFGYANREVLRQKVRQTLQDFSGQEVRTELVYDFGHNSISLEHEGGKQVLLHRKGSSRAFPKLHPDNPQYYFETGHPIIVPGSLGTPTYILVGTEKLKDTHYSINHGAGRKYTRGYVESKKDQPRFRESLDNVFVNLGFKDYCAETPNAYKDIEEVIKTLEQNKLVRKVAKLQPFFAYLEKD